MTSPAYNSMIQFTRGTSGFNYRVAGVAFREGRALLHRFEGEDFWCLPGGRVELQESAETALIREMDEEMGLRVTVDRLIWVVENFFHFSGVDQHELGLYFSMSLPDEHDRTGLEPFTGKEATKQISFAWFTQAEARRVKVYPQFLSDALWNLPASTAHIVHRDQQ